jgi:hypothetical protein
VSSAQAYQLGLVLRNSPQPRNRLRGIEAKDFGDLDEFDDVNAALAAFQPYDKRLIFPQTLGELGLGQADAFAPPDDQVDQGAVTLGSKRFVQSESRKLNGLSVI